MRQTRKCIPTLTVAQGLLAKSGRVGVSAFLLGEVGLEQSEVLIPLTRRNFFQHGFCFGETM